jgi:hypothetical protein
MRVLFIAVPTNSGLYLGLASCAVAVIALWTALHRRYFRYPSFRAKWNRVKDPWNQASAGKCVALVVVWAAQFVAGSLVLFGQWFPAGFDPPFLLFFGTVALTTVEICLLWFLQAAWGYRPDTIRVLSEAELAALSKESLEKMRSGFQGFEADQALAEQALKEIIRRQPPWYDAVGRIKFHGDSNFHRQLFSLGELLVSRQLVTADELPQYLEAVVAELRKSRRSARKVFDSGYPSFALECAGNLAVEGRLARGVDDIASAAAALLPASYPVNYPHLDPVPAVVRAATADPSLSLDIGRVQRITSLRSLLGSPEAYANRERFTELMRVIDQIPTGVVRNHLEVIESIAATAQEHAPRGLATLGILFEADPALFLEVAEYATDFALVAKVAHTAPLVSSLVERRLLPRQISLIAKILARSPDVAEYSLKWSLLCLAEGPLPDWTISDHVTNWHNAAMEIAPMLVFHKDWFESWLSEFRESLGVARTEATVNPAARVLKALARFVSVTIEVDCTGSFDDHQSSRTEANPEYRVVASMLLEALRRQPAHRMQQFVEAIEATRRRQDLERLAQAAESAV